MIRGIVLGHFCPLHNGHVALIRTAAQLVDHLTVVVCVHGDDDPAGVTRIQWLLEMFPSHRTVGLEVVSLPGDVGTPDHGPSWARQLRTLHPEPIDRVFASDPRQRGIADALEARFVLIDPDHAMVPVRSAEVRARLRDHWRFLPQPVRPSYATTICLHGPESTGKSTLAAALSRHYHTCFVPEYGRTYCEQFGRALAMEDLVEIGRTHAAMTAAMSRQCNARLFLDTDPLMTAAWADMLFGRRDPWFDGFTATADLYLLMDTDTPFVDDGLRFFGGAAERRRFFDLSRAELDRRGVRYQVIGGPAKDRLARAIEVIEQGGF